MIEQGEVYWVEFSGSGSEPLGLRPALVVQDDRYNRSGLRTIVVAALTSNLRRAGAPGNVELAKGEAGLPKASVVNVTQIVTLDRGRLRRRVGRLSRSRIVEVLGGLALVFGWDQLRRA